MAGKLLSRIALAASGIRDGFFLLVSAAVMVLALLLLQKLDLFPIFRPVSSVLDVCAGGPAVG
jgi:hypothetical protein